MKILKNFINKIFLHINRPYVLIHPEIIPVLISYKALIENIFWLSINKKIKNAFIYLAKFIFKIFFDLIKIIYLPISVSFYFSKYRFIQVDYSQIGTFGHQLQVMVKYNHLRNKKSLIFVPRTLIRSHIKKIFSNLKIIDSMILNILAQPLIQTNFISCEVTNAECLYERDGKKIGRNYPTQIIQTFEEKFGNSLHLFDLKLQYIKEMEKFFISKFKNFDIQKTIVLHVRDESFLASSYLRGASLENYFPTINYLLDNNYFVIRLIHSKSKKLKFSNNYAELDTNEVFNQFFQYYLIAKCKGFINCHSGPGSLGALMNTPMLAVNIFYPYTFATKKNDIYLLKRIKNRENKIINYIELFNKDFYDKYAVSQTKMSQYGYVALENTKDEILEATKEFLEINKGNFYNLNKDQKSFIKNIPQTSCFRYLDSRISCYFQKKYPKLF